MILNLQRFSTHDGPGIRTVVFFKGCPLNCWWCENPESQSFEREYLFSPARCIHCRTCKDYTGIEYSDTGPHAVCRTSEAPAKSLCPTGALGIAGMESNPGDLVEEILKDQAFFVRSGGGVTFSGGEPLVHASCLRSLISTLGAQGIHVAIESCLAADWAVIETLIEYSPLWLVDLKHVNAETLFRFTGGDCPRILSNMENLVRSGASIVIRVPLIPGFNDDRTSIDSILEHISYIDQIARTCGSQSLHVDLLPYHDLARGKYAALGRSYPIAQGAKVDLRQLAYCGKVAAQYGLSVTIGG